MSKFLILCVLSLGLTSHASDTKHTTIVILEDCGIEEEGRFIAKNLTIETIDSFDSKIAMIRFYGRHRTYWASVETAQSIQKGEVVDITYARLTKGIQKKSWILEFRKAKDSGHLKIN